MRKAFGSTTHSSPAPPAPYRLLSPRPRRQVVLICEHASRRLPPGMRATKRERELLATHWGWDIGAWDLTRELSGRLGAPAVGGRYSRLAIDLNRRLDDPTLIRRAVEGVELGWNLGVDVAELERRFVAYHAPFHLQVDRLVLRKLLGGERPLIFAVHTFTELYQGRARRFDAGVLYDAHRDLAHRLGRALRRGGLDVRYNQPYSGMAGLMYAADRHGTHYGLPCLELEINQALFRRRGAAKRLGGIVGRAVESILARPGAAAGPGG